MVVKAIIRLQTAFKKVISNTLQKKAGPIAKRSKSSDLDCGRGDPGSNPGEGMCFFFGMVN